MQDERELNKELLQVSDREQRLLAQELHDSLCQTLVGLSFLIKAAVRQTEKGRPMEPAELARINNQIDLAIDQSHFCMLPQILASRPLGLPDALKELAKFVGARVACKFHLEGEKAPLAPQVAQAFYRMARETVRTLTDRKGTSHIIMVLSQTKTETSLEIRFEPCSPSDLSLIEGDGLLRRFSIAASLEWKAATDAQGAVSLRCTYAAPESSGPP